MKPVSEKETKLNKAAGGKKAYGAVKRVLDVIISLVALLVFLPLFIIILLAVFFTDFHNPIYCQKRVGKGGREFSLIKFRTMRHDADDFEKYMTPDQLKLYHSEYKLEDDPRITKLGKLLRSFSVDELPQFFNVIAGQMSLIGPRPIVEKETHYYNEKRDLLLSVRPGITGLWQVSGRNDLTYESGDRQRCELEYVENFGFGMDFKIFLKTFKEIFSGRGN
ncbi:MAG: sugar transferase [Clostridia bacterium]|nr:sugar transferase [Clostridia bacterium]